MDDNLKNLLVQQQANVSELLVQSENMLAVIKEGREETGLDEILKRRREVMEDMAKTGEKINAKKGEIEENLLKALSATMEKVLKVDRECREILENRKSEVAKKVGEILKGGSVIKGYRPDAGGGTGRFISVKR